MSTTWVRSVGWPQMLARLHGISLRQTQLGFVPWYEWVPSPSNVADGGSREGVTDEVAASLGFHLQLCRLPSLPRDFVNMSPRDWHAFWG